MKTRKLMSKPDHLSELKFAELGLHPTLQTSLDQAGFEYCTPIQAQSLPLLLKGTGVAGQAQTGTGKTATFLLAVMHHLLTKPAPNPDSHSPRALIMAPTRELAIQIHKDAIELGKQTNIRLGLAYGGANYDKQRDAIAAGCDILIGTPGRLIDYLKQGVYDLKNIQAAVLDEADRMFDLGFIADVRYVFRRMPPANERLNLLFSATLSQKVLELAYEHLGKPENVKIEAEQITADKVRQQVFMPANPEKLPLLIGILRQQDPHRTIIFVNTKRDGDKVWGSLVANGFEAQVLSGDVPQNKRQRYLKQFAEGELPILVATDVAARGLHIPGVSHVINYDLPTDAEDYVHRIGRTARAGTEGDAISFACETYAMYLPEIEAYIEQKLTIDQFESSLLAEDLNPPKRRERANGGQTSRSGGRGNQRNNPRNNRGGGGNSNRSGQRSGSRSNQRSGNRNRPDKHSENNDNSNRQDRKPNQHRDNDTTADQQQRSNNRNRNRNRNRNNRNGNGNPQRNNVNQQNPQQVKQHAEQRQPETAAKPTKKKRWWWPFGE